jgi:outer membrane protein
MLAPAVFLSLSAGRGPAAELKIGTIDFKKVFDDYYKTKLADASIKDEAGGLDKDLKILIDDHDKAVSDHKKALEEANNQAVSADEREKRKKEAETKLIKINDLRQTIEQFKRTADGNLGEKLRRARDNIVNEIRAAVTVKAKSLGYTMVLDTGSPEPGGRPPLVIYTNGDNDLTQTIIAQLNANAPADLPLGNDKKEKDKEKEKDKKEEKK